MLDSLVRGGRYRVGKWRGRLGMNDLFDRTKKEFIRRIIVFEN